MKNNPSPRRRGLHPWVVGIALGLPLCLQAAPLGENLAGLLDHARTHNPDLSALQYDAEAARQRTQPAGALPDPVLRVELENINNYGNNASPSLWPSKVGDTKYTLMQPLPAWGKRDLKRDAASADARQAQSQASALWSELSAKIKVAHAQHYLVTTNERIAKEVLDLMARLEKLAQARYASGLAAQQDAIRAQLEQTAMRAELVSLNAEKRQIQARLNTLLARDVGAPLSEPKTLRPTPDLNFFDTEHLAQKARATNPSLAAEEARLQSTLATRDLIQRNRYPDFVVGVAPTQMGSRVTTWGVMLEMNLPLRRESRRSQEREAEAMVSAQRDRVQAQSTRLQGELGENLAALEAARRTEALIGGQLLPQSELGFRSALAAYETGKVDFATLLDAQRLIRKAKSDQVKAQVDAQMRLADIERIVGEDL